MSIVEVIAGSDIISINVKNRNANVENNKIVSYGVNANVSFEVDEH